MRKALATVCLLLLSLGIFGQEPNDIEQFCIKAIEAANKDQFSEALKYYDAAVAIISETDRPDLITNFNDDLISYIIQNLASEDKNLAGQYAQTALAMRMSCLEHFNKVGYFDSDNDYLDYMSSEYQKMGYLLENNEVFNIAENCFVLGIDLYKNKEYYSETYWNARENLAFFYADYIKEPRKGLSIQYQTFLKAAQLYGIDANYPKQVFSRLLLIYLFPLRTLALLDDQGRYNQVNQLGLPTTDYDSAAGLINDWQMLKQDLVKYYDPSIIAIGRDLLNLDMFGDPSILVGSDECDELFRVLLSIHFNKDNYSQVLERLNNALETPEQKLNYFTLVITALNNNRLYALSFNIYQELYDYYRQVNRKDLSEDIDAMRCSLALQLGDYDKANSFLTAYGFSEDIQHENDIAYISMLSHLSHLYYYRDYDFQRALEITRKAISHAEKGDLYDSTDGYYRLHQLSLLYNDLASCYYAIHDFPAALSMYNESVQICKKRASRLGEYRLSSSSVLWPVVQYTGIADCYIDQGDYSSAKAILEDCLKYYQSFAPESPALLKVYDGLVYLSSFLGDSESQLLYVEDSFSLRNRVYIVAAQSMTKSQRIDYWFKLQGFDLEVLADLATKNNQLAVVAYNSALFQKGLLLKMEQHINECIENTIDPDLIAAYNAYINTSGESSSIDRADVEERMMVLYSRHPEFITEFSFPTWQDVQSCLGKKDVAIEFAKACSDGKNSTYVAMLVRPGWDYPRIINLGEESQFDRYLSMGPKAYLNDSSLYSLIWEKLEPYLSGIKNIYFSPDAALSQLNIEVLRNKKSVPINKEYNVFRLSSTKNLCESSKEQIKRNAVLFGGLNYDASTEEMVSVSRSISTSTPVSKSFFSPASITRKGWTYLPGTKEEVALIHGILNNRKIENRLITDSGGTEEVFNAMSGDSPSILHIATHGFYYSEKSAERNRPSLLSNNENDSHTYPLQRCGLILSGGQHSWLGEPVPEGLGDGILSGEEIANMDLSNTSLVVLSACQTGLGDFGADGVYGLQRAFKIAGAGTIIMSLWEVNDESTELMMTEFYSRLASGKSKRDSFDGAINAVKAKYDSPEHWAAFIMLD